MSDTILSVQNISKLYGLNKSAAQKLLAEGADKARVAAETGVTVAINNVSFEVERGSIFVLIGLSGSGKSTVVRCLNLLHRPTSGKVLFEGRDIGQFSKKELLDYRRSKISMVFQSFGLMSHRDVLGNVAYGLEVRGVPKEEREQKAMEMIEMVGLSGWEHKGIDNLSGGMRQRVGIARALASDPDILLMDEPFSALDPLVRRDMQFELLSIQRKMNKTIIFITHDINEAFKLGDRVGIMRDGRIIQIDTPENMSMHPADDYVKEFVGSADKAQVFSAQHIMVTPSCLIRRRDSAVHALQEMRSNGVSSAFVVDSHMNFAGLLPLEGALKARKNEEPIEGYIVKDVPTVSPEMSISDLMPIAADAKYPIVVLDEGGGLRGIVTKASVISSLV